jgi:signal transduction histidine kinase
LLDTILETQDRDSQGIAQELVWGIPPKSFFMAHANPVRDDEGEVFGSVTIFNDVTKLKEFDRMKSEFVDMVSHEERSPLSSMRQKLSILSAGYVGDITGEQKDIVERVQQRIDALIGMTSNLLDLSRIESGRLVQQKERLHLAEIISETVTMMMPEAEKKGLHCEVTVDSGLYPVHADRQGMETVFTNLIANAIKYNRAGGSISVRACNRGECVEIRIKDSGVGIARENFSRIFDKFFRIRTDDTRSVAGSGIGLPLVKAIVEAHFGTIEVESEPERGSTFTVLIPRGRS